MYVVHIRYYFLFLTFKMRVLPGKLTKCVPNLSFTTEAVLIITIFCINIETFA